MGGASSEGTGWGELVVRGRAGGSVPEDRVGTAWMMTLLTQMRPALYS